VKRGEATQIVVFKIFAISLPSQPFIAATLDFTSFSQWPSWGLQTFFTAGFFLD